MEHLRTAILDRIISKHHTPEMFSASPQGYEYDATTVTELQYRKVAKPKCKHKTMLPTVSSAFRVGGVVGSPVTGAEMHGWAPRHRDRWFWPGGQTPSGCGDCVACGGPRQQSTSQVQCLHQRKPPQQCFIYLACHHFDSHSAMQNMLIMSTMSKALLLSSSKLGCS